MSEMGKKVTKNGTKVTETQASKTRKIKGCRARDQIRIPLPLLFIVNRRFAKVTKHHSRSEFSCAESLFIAYRSFALEIRSPDRPYLSGLNYCNTPKLLFFSVRDACSMLPHFRIPPRLIFFSIRDVSPFRPFQREYPHNWYF